MMEDQSRSQIQSGEEIPSLRVMISKISMMMYAAATWNPFQLHWDSDYSRENGFQDANVAGPMFGDYLCEMLVRFAGSSSRVKRLEYTNRGMAFPGDTLICKGKVLKTHQEEGKGYIDCQVWVENQRGERLVEGDAIVCV